eukprot:6421290-Alexandrium_andersonii.AAC.1
MQARTNARARTRTHARSLVRSLARMRRTMRSIASTAQCIAGLASLELVPADGARAGGSHRGQ